MKRWEQELIRNMPKAELHLHLDGSLRVKTAMEWLGVCGWQDTFEKMVVCRRLLSQKKLLEYFDVPTRLLQTEEALTRATRELIEDKAADHVSYCEIRWAPQLHTMGGLTLEQVIEAVLAGRREGEEKTGVGTQLIAVALRAAPIEDNLRMLEAVRTYREHGIAAIDFAGAEEDFPDPAAQREYFERAREYGFFITFHCGEVAGMEKYMPRAIEILRPTRIAHGAPAVNSPEICDMLRERNIMLELCPTSNMQAGLYRDVSHHPLCRLDRMGVPVSVNTDDPVLSDITLSEEYVRLVKHGGLTLRDCWRLNIAALDVSFAPKEQKIRLKDNFELWASTIDELR